MQYDVCIISGFGHVGLPLSIAFALKGLKTCAFDISPEKKELIESRKMPFLEEHGEEMLVKAIASGNLFLSTEKSVIRNSNSVIITIGTTLDEHGGPKLTVIEDMINQYSEEFVDGQLIVLRSTVFPGTTNRIIGLFKSMSKKVKVSFCPERIVEGQALKELFELPQIVGAVEKEDYIASEKLFRVLTKEILMTGTVEAELAKLLSNSWRYIKFSAANQFYTLCDEADVDFYKVLDVMQYKYPRAQDLPKAGFSAGPCLFKDTSQLSAFNNNRFLLGNAAISVNEGLPYYVVSKLKEKYDLRNKIVGILGMAFKSNIDDSRDSLSYTLKDLLKYYAKSVLCSDPYVTDNEFLEAEKLIELSDIVILGTPHTVYKKLSIPKDKVMVDIWNFFPKE